MTHLEDTRGTGLAVVGGIIGAIAGFVFPGSMIVVQRVVGITDPGRPSIVTPDGPVEYGVGTVGYWASWIVTFGVILAIGVVSSRKGRARAFATPATLAFAVIAVPISLLFIAFDFGGAPHPS
ncbi:hypothetical protein ACFXPR_09350 [Nocardia tengchongensis]|uniref:hypothetical protein n=1 Tax=Nocardia tengchongensis TaxID=2055889 RepID=UPI00368C4394